MSVWSPASIQEQVRLFVIGERRCRGSREFGRQRCVPGPVADGVFDAEKHRSWQSPAVPAASTRWASVQQPAGEGPDSM